MPFVAHYQSSLGKPFRLMEESTFRLPFNSRAFQYGDGLFETLIGKNDCILRLEKHLNRLEKGMEALSLGLLTKASKESIVESIRALTKANSSGFHTRVKIYAWRAEGGLYTPSSNHFELLVSVAKHSPQTTFSELRLDVCQTIRNQHSPASPFKTLSSLKYTLAGLEKKERKLDDLLILDASGYVSECVASNLFWFSDGEFFTPSAQTGCVEGVRKSAIKSFLKNGGYKVNEVKAKLTQLLEARFAFNCNVAGIHFISEIQGVPFPKTQRVGKLLNELISKT